MHHSGKAVLAAVAAAVITALDNSGQSQGNMITPCKEQQQSTAAELVC